MSDGQPNFNLQYPSADIQKLAKEYVYKDGDDKGMLDAGKRIRKEDYSLENLEVIYRWKSQRKIGLFRKNSPEEIKQALKRASEAKDVKEAVDSLTQLDGVAVRMASAILTAINPELYTVFDVRALEALGMKTNNYNVDLYVKYLEYCRSTAKKHNVSLRDFDRANWWWSKKEADAAHCEECNCPTAAVKG